MPTSYGNLEGTYGQGTYGSGVYESTNETPYVVSPSTYYLYPYGSIIKSPLSRINFTPEVDSVKFGRAQVLAGGATVRDIVATKRTIKLAWTWLPSRDDDVIDGGAGFATLLSYYTYVNTDGGKLTLEMPDGLGGREVLTVFMGNQWTINLNRRASGMDAGQKSLFWDVSFTVSEV